MTTQPTHDSIENDPLKEAYFNIAILAKPPEDPVAAGEFWFRQGIVWQQKRVAREQFTPSKLEVDPFPMLQLALERARNHWHSNLRVEHFLELAIDDPSHTLSRALKERGTYTEFRAELSQFIGEIDKDNPGGMHEPVATPAALRVFEDLSAGTLLSDAICKEELPNWSRSLLERHLSKERRQTELL